MPNSQGHIHCSIVTDKAQAPIKAVSIPKLELTAAVVSVRLEQLVHTELCIIYCKFIFWTDATAVLQIIKNASKQFPVFIANWIAIIGEHTSVNQWHFVPTKSNLADFASRPLTANYLSSSHMWLSGLPFLWQSSEHRPNKPLSVPDLL